MTKKILILFLIFTIFVFANFSFAFDKNNMTKEEKEMAVKKAILFSSVLPGSGQYYYGNKLKAAVFGALEIGTVVGYFIYQGKGDDKTKEYKDFANKNYSREQYRINRDKIVLVAYQGSQDWGVLGNLENDPFDIFWDPSTSQNFEYSKTYFMLDNENSGHFYEDIGKYEKYWIGWLDYGVYQDDGSIISPVTNQEGENLNSWKQRLLNEKRSSMPIPPTKGYRNTYWDIRKKSNDYYGIADLCLNLLLVNHLISAIDAGYFTYKKIKSDDVSFNLNVIPNLTYFGIKGAKMEFSVKF